MPSIITLLALLAAALFWWRSALPTAPSAETVQADPIPADDSPRAAAQGQFKPSERIRADSVVAFPADI